MTSITADAHAALPARAPDGAAALATERDAVARLGPVGPVPRIDSPRIAADLDAAEADAAAFAEPIAGKLASLPGAALAAALAEYERIEEILGRVMSFAQLQFSGDGTDAGDRPLHAVVLERVTAISSHLIFFSLELNRLDDAVLDAKLADPALARWQPFLRDLRVFRPHQLSDEAEKLLHEKDVTGAQAWSRLFDETVAGMRVPFGGAELTVSDVLNKLSDRDRAVREQAGTAIGAGVRRAHQAVRPDHQHAGQGQGDRRHLAPLPAPGSAATAPTWSRTRWWTRW